MLVSPHINKWLKPWKFMLAVNQGSVGVKFVDGTEETRQIPATYLVSVDRGRASIVEALGCILPEWAGVSLKEKFGEAVHREYMSWMTFYLR